MTLPPRSFAPAFQRGDTMEDEVDTLRGILVGVLTGSTLWLMIIYAWSSYL